MSIVQYIWLQELLRLLLMMADKEGRYACSVLHSTQLLFGDAASSLDSAVGRSAGLVSDDQLYNRSALSIVSVVLLRRFKKGVFTVFVLYYIATATRHASVNVDR